MGFLDAEAQLTGNFVADHWHGRHSLPRAYWINGFLIAGLGGGFLAVLAGSIAEADLSVQTVSAISLGIMAFGFAVWLWSVVGIWRSAARHVDRGGSANWAGIAKALVVLGGLAMTGQLVNSVPATIETARLAANYDPLGAPAKLSVAGSTLILEGPIAQGTADLVSEQLSADPGIDRITLNSIGGRMRDAEQIARLIRDRGMSTEAVNECASACTLILLAGERRAAAIGSRIGFHQPDFPGLELEERRQMVESLRKNYLAAGVPGSFVRQALATPPDSMWYPTEQELLKAGVLNGMTRERVRQDHIVSAAQTNRDTPKRLDELTVLRSAEATGETLTFYYQIEASRDEIDRAQATTILREQNEREICAQPLIPELIESGARYRFVYDDRTGRRIADVLVGEC